MKINKIIPLILLFIIIVTYQFLHWSNQNNKVITKNITIKDCEVQKKTCSVNLDGLIAKISFDENIFYLKKFNVSVFVENTNNSIIDSIQLDFKMKGMNMGVNRFKLTETQINNNKSFWRGKALLPVCVTGRADWFSVLEIVFNKQKYIITFPVYVKKSTR